MSGHSPATGEVLRIGVYEFKDDVAKRTNGDVNIELFGANTLCTELTCTSRNVCGGARVQLVYADAHTHGAVLRRAGFSVHVPRPRLDVLPLLSRSPRRSSASRCARRYNVEFLWTTAELRNTFIGQKWRDRPPVRQPDDIKGAKIHVPRLGPRPHRGRTVQRESGSLDWAETLEGLKSGVVDGQEPSALPRAAATWVA